MPLAKDGSSGFANVLASHPRSMTPQPNGSRGRTQQQQMNSTTRKSASSERGKENVHPPMSKEEALAMKVPVPNTLPRGPLPKNSSKLINSTTMQEPVKHAGNGKQGGTHANESSKAQAQNRNVYPTSTFGNSMSAH
jgi:hypothetical protein